MKVALLSTNDIRGGAAIVTLRLTQALRDAGVSANMICARMYGSDIPCVIPSGDAPRFKRTFLAERLQIFAHNGLNRAELFKTDTAAFGLPLADHPVIQDADVVVLTWINQGFLSLREIRKIASQKPVVWIMHDMWPVTGVCHHAGTCYLFTGDCRNCPMLRPRKHNSLAARVLARKKALAEECGIHFVAVSNWLGEKAAVSAVSASAPRTVIPNPFPTEDFTGPSHLSREALGLPSQGKIVMLAAARLDDDIKGLPLAIAALNRAGAERKDITALFVGELRNPETLASLKIPYIHTGAVSDHERMHALYCAADVVLSSSHFETLPTTLIEGQAAGTVPVAFDRGGQRDIIAHGETGYLVPYPDTEALAAGIVKALDAEISSDKLRDSVAEKFSAQTVARRYIALFHKLLEDRNKS